jgi:hypothetical protein
MVILNSGSVLEIIIRVFRHLHINVIVRNKKRRIAQAKRENIELGKGGTLPPHLFSCLFLGVFLWKIKEIKLNYACKNTFTK